MSTLATSFKPFSGLPAELRNEIWQQALPDQLGPALFFHKKGCWRTRRLNEDDEDYEPPVNDDSNWIFEHRTELLDAVELNLPMALVNHEARAVARAWARQQGLTARTHDDSRFPGFVRAFDRQRDALYISDTEWDGLMFEAIDQPWHEPDLQDRIYNTRAYVEQVAVPERFMQQPDLSEKLRDLFAELSGVRVLYVVVNPPSEWDRFPSSRETSTQPWWSWRDGDGCALYWDSAGGRFDVVGWDGQGGRPPGWWMGISEALAAQLAHERVRSFAIRPIFTFLELV